MWTDHADLLLGQIETMQDSMMSYLWRGVGSTEVKPEVSREVAEDGEEVKKYNPRPTFHSSPIQVGLAVGLNSFVMFNFARSLLVGFLVDGNAMGLLPIIAAPFIFMIAQFFFVRLALPLLIAAIPADPSLRLLYSHLSSVSFSSSSVLSLTSTATPSTILASGRCAWPASSPTSCVASLPGPAIPCTAG
jgi:hypothetical protein